MYHIIMSIFYHTSFHFSLISLLRAHLSFVKQFDTFDISSCRNKMLGDADVGITS